MANRLSPGDVLDLAAPDGHIYLHYLGRHAEYGDGVAVCPTKQAASTPVRSELFRFAYVAFYPASAAVAQGLAAVVAQLPATCLPKVLRRPGVRSGRKVETWIIEDGIREVVRQELSDEERSLPIAVIWNHELLIQRVTQGWRPEMEGRRE